MLQVYIAVLAVLLGIVAGILAALLGMGGGTLLVPVLIIFFGLEPKIAVATSLMALLFKSCSATSGYIRKKLVDIKTGLKIIALAVPGSIIGANLTEMVSGEVIKIAFSMLLLIIAYKMLTSKKKSVKELKERTYLKVSLAFLAGFVSGFLGVGGGIIFVPLLHLVFKKDIKVSIATSTFMILFNALIGFLTHSILCHVDYTLGLLIGLGTVFGSQIGVKICIESEPRKLKKITGAFLVAMSLRLLLSEFL